MSTLKTPFRYDFVGSFLRPQALKDAKAKYQNNDITKEEYDNWRYNYPQKQSKG